MRSARDLHWEGTFNTRDLGGLPRTAGGVTRRGSVIRSDAPDRLTDAGWAAAREYGVRTLIDLREPDEDGPVDAPPAGVSRTLLPLDGLSDTEFWTTWGGGFNATPLYYRAFFDHFPERIAEVVGCIADAPHGGVLFHCSGGRDRTGLITLVLLSLAGVDHEAIVADYLASVPRLEPLWQLKNLGDQTAMVDAFMRSHGTTLGESIHQALDSLDAVDVLRSGGLSTAQLRAVEARLLA
jgi:protein tyrosine/serine phosphatase